jgi:hypothetical protein
MADLITISQLSALVEDQYRLLSFLEDHREAVPTFDPVFPDRNEAYLDIDGSAWSVTAVRGGWEFCHRGSGRTVELAEGHPSPFDFRPAALLRFVQSTDADSRLTDIVIDNWILRYVLAGRLSASRHRPGYYTFA